MASFQQVTILGRLGKDPQMTSAQSGNKIAKITIATEERGYTKRDGTKVEDKTEWHNITFFGKLAEIVEKYLHKGSMALVQGKLHTSTYEKDGQKRYSVDIVGEMLQMLGGKSDNSQQSSQAPSASQQAAIQALNNAGLQVEQTDEEVPF